MRGLTVLLEFERMTDLMLSVQDHREELIEVIALVLQRSPGTVPVFLTIFDAVGRRLQLKASSDFAINPNNLAKGELETLLGPGRVQVSRQGNGKG